MTLTTASAPAVRWGDDTMPIRARSQRLLVTLFGDYWEPTEPPLPSAGLVRALAEFDITAADARAALSRMTRRGLLHRTKQGRRTSYAMSPTAWRVLVRGAQRIFAEVDEPAWDGAWTLIAFSLPGDDGGLRRLLRARLRWLTFTPLYDGSWVTPHDRVDAAREQLDELGIQDAIVVRATDLDLKPEARSRLHQAWDLCGLAERYETWLAQATPMVEMVRKERIDPTEALVQRTRLVESWRGLVRDDPEVPQALLSAPLPRARARRIFLEIYRALQDPARQRFTALMGTAGS